MRLYLLILPRSKLVLKEAHTELVLNKKTLGRLDGPVGWVLAPVLISGLGV